MTKQHYHKSILIHFYSNADTGLYIHAYNAHIRSYLKKYKTNWNSFSMPHLLPILKKNRSDIVLRTGGRSVDQSVGL